MSADGGEKRAAPALSADDERRARLKAAGEAYFAKVLNQSKGKDLLAAAKSASASAPLSVAGTGSSNAATGRLPLTTFDEDFLQAGAVIEGARTYVLGTVFVAAHAVQLVFLKSSLMALRIPALMLFLHLLPTALTLWLLAAQGVLELRPLGLRAVRGGAVAAALAGVQSLALFWAVLHTPVLLVLCWTVAAPHALRAVLEVAASRQLPARERLGALAASLACTAMALLAQWPGVLGLLALLLWTAADLVAAAWAALRLRPELIQEFAQQRPGAASTLQQLADAEGSLDHCTLVLLRHALPAVPVLLLGLLLGEGTTLIDHELSVPAVSTILFSVLAMCVAAASDLLMSGGLTRVAHEALVAAGPLGTVVTEAAVHGLGSPLAFVAAIACSLAGVLLRVTAAGAAAS